MDFLGRDQREAFGQVEAHLVAEHAAGAGAGAVGLGGAMRVHMAHEVFVLGADGALGHVLISVAAEQEIEGVFKLWLLGLAAR